MHFSSFPISKIREDICTFGPTTSSNDSPKTGRQCRHFDSGGKIVASESLVTTLQTIVLQIAKLRDGGWIEPVKNLMHQSPATVHLCLLGTGV